MSTTAAAVKTEEEGEVPGSIAAPSGQGRIPAHWLRIAEEPCEKCGGQVQQGRVDILKQDGKPIICITCAQAEEQKMKAAPIRRFIPRATLQRMHNQGLLPEA